MKILIKFLTSVEKAFLIQLIFNVIFIIGLIGFAVFCYIKN